MSKIQDYKLCMLRLTTGMHQKIRKKADELNITMTAVIKLCIGKFIDNIDNEEDLLK